MIMADEYKSLEAMRREEAARVKAMIDRDRADRIREADRKRAEIELANGSFVNIADSVIEPTPEWLAKGDVATYRPKQPDGTVREVKTVKRVLTPIVVRMYNQGRIDDEMAKACLWFRQMYEYSGMTGRWSTSNMSSITGATSSSAKNVGGFAGHIPMTETEAVARQYYRMAVEAIPAYLRKFFLAVVINDLSLRRACLHARCRNDQAMDRFRTAASSLVSFCNSERVELSTLRASD